MASAPGPGGGSFQLVRMIAFGCPFCVWFSPAIPAAPTLAQKVIMQKVLQHHLDSHVEQMAQTVVEATANRLEWATCDDIDGVAGGVGGGGG